MALNAAFAIEKQPGVETGQYVGYIGNDIDDLNRSICYESCVGSIRSADSEIDVGSCDESDRARGEGEEKCALHFYILGDDGRQKSYECTMS